jgi:hypothetical protein
MFYVSFVREIGSEGSLNLMSAFPRKSLPHSFVLLGAFHAWSGCLNLDQIGEYLFWPRLDY